MVLRGRQFVDEAGNRWTAFRAGSSFRVIPKPAPGRKLHDVARSCANVLAVEERPTQHRWSTSTSTFASGVLSGNEDTKWRLMLMRMTEPRRSKAKHGQGKI